MNTSIWEQVTIEEFQTTLVHIKNFETRTVRICESPIKYYWDLDQPMGTGGEIYETAIAKVILNDDFIEAGKARLEYFINRGCLDELFT